MRVIGWLPNTGNAAQSRRRSRSAGTRRRDAKPIVSDLAEFNPADEDQNLRKPIVSVNGRDVAPEHLAHDSKEAA